MKYWVRYRYLFNKYNYFVSFTLLDKARNFRDELMYKSHLVASCTVLDREPTKQELSGK